MYCKEKWRTAGGKDPLFGRVDGFQIDPREIQLQIFCRTRWLSASCQWARYPPQHLLKPGGGCEAVCTPLRHTPGITLLSCTKEILNSLGEMYAAGGEFTENIDKAGGEGTAVFAQRAIAIYCR